MWAEEKGRLKTGHPGACWADGEEEEREVEEMEGHKVELNGEEEKKVSGELDQPHIIHIQASFHTLADT